MADDLVLRGVWTDEAAIDRETGRIALECQQEVAAQGRANVQRILDADVRNPTPYYETKIRVERAALDMVVNDSKVRYGPWLEGTSDRNESTSFKGYHAFRRARQQLEAQVPQLTDAVVRRHTDRTG